MRALLLLLAVALVAVFAVRWLDPGSAAAASSSEAEAPTEARFLAAPPSIQQEEAADDPKSPSGAPSMEATPEARQEPAWPASLVPVAKGPDSDLAVAAALVHGTPADVQAATVTLPKDRALLLEAFAWELVGERQMALALSKDVDRNAVDARERALFEALLTAKSATPASVGGSPVAMAMEMALLSKSAERALSAKDFAGAARDYSSLLLAEVSAPWAPDREALGRWTQGLDAAQREHRWSPRGGWPSVEMKVQSGDTLIAIRLRYLQENPGARLCTGLIERANRIRGYLQPNQTLRVPTDPARVLVDLDARWALYFLGDEVAAAWPICIGRPGEETPPGEYTVRNKLENPPWMKEGQEPVPFGDPRNPLGTRWIGWSLGTEKTSYGFHGTWDPDTIGQAASDGCVRFLNEDVEELFQVLPEGAPILVQG